MKTLKNSKAVQFLSCLMGILFIGKDKPKCDMKTSLEPMLSELEIKMQWGEFMQTLEKNAIYLAAVKKIQSETYQKIGFKPKEYPLYLNLPWRMVSCLIRNYSYPSDYVLN